MHFSTSDENFRRKVLFGCKVKVPSTHLRLDLNNWWLMAVFVSNTTAWKLNEKTAQTANVVTWPDLTVVLHMVDWFENFSSWDCVLAGITLFWIMLFILPGLYNCTTKFSSLIQWRINNVERESKNSFSSIFHTEDNWHAFIEPTFVFGNKAYDST